MSATATGAYVIVRVHCHARHPDAAKQNGAPVACGNVLGDVLGPVRFVGTSARAPAHPDGRIWLKCSRTTCKTWSCFELVAPRGAGD